MGAKLTELASKLNAWTNKGKMVYDAVKLCQSVQKEKKRTAAQDIRGRIREMQQSKDEMVRVFTLVRQLSIFMGVPFVSSYITMYAAIFSQLGNLCDKIANYALRIAEETEAVLGQNGSVMNAINNPNSVFSLSKSWAAKEKMQTH
jgi:hypothetical protein